MKHVDLVGHHWGSEQPVKNPTKPSEELQEMCFSPEPSTCGQAGRAPVPLGEDSLEGISSPTLEGCLQALWGGWPGILSQRGGGAVRETQCVVLATERPGSS